MNQYLSVFRGCIEAGLQNWCYTFQSLLLLLPYDNIENMEPATVHQREQEICYYDIAKCVCYFHFCSFSNSRKCDIMLCPLWRILIFMPYSYHRQGFVHALSPQNCVRQLPEGQHATSYKLTCDGQVRKGWLHQIACCLCLSWS